MKTDEEKLEKKGGHEENLYKDKVYSITTLVKDITGLREGKQGTMLINEYAIEDDQVKATVQLKNEIEDWWLEYKWDIIVAFYFAIVFIFTTYKVIRLVQSAIAMDNQLLNVNYTEAITIILLTSVFWLISTSVKILSLSGHKMKLLNVSIYVISSWIIFLVYNYLYRITIPWIGTIKVDAFMTVEKIILLAWLMVNFPTVIIGSLFPYITLRNIYGNEHNKQKIKDFKLKHYINPNDKRDKYSYDLKIFRDDESGKVVRIRELDRFTHMETTGATGTGKTSSWLIKIINSDLVIKVRNLNKQKKLVESWVKKGWAYLTRPFDDEDFTIEYIRPNKGYEEKFEKEIKRYRNAGITVMAPDDSLIDQAYELAKAKGFRKINRIDPRRNEDGTVKEGSKGHNPFYISPLVPEWRREKEIIKNATLFADIMHIIHDMSGKQDPYFASVNRIASTTVAVTLMLTFPSVHGRQPTPDDLKDIINDFSRIRPYYKELQSSPFATKYKAILDTIANDFIGKGKEEFEKHCRGLRVQLNNFLLDPEIRRILCQEESVDMDKMLRDGEITLVNIELGELGPVYSPAFGLFFSIAFQNAVLYRPGNERTRLPHFWTIDELPVLVSPSLETSLVLFRKFRTGMSLALQTFDQFHKNPFLKYLKGILLNSCSHHIFFGRTNPEDGDIVKQLGGMIDRVKNQEGVSGSSLLDENPTRNYQLRSTVEKVDRITGDQQRMLDFQEVTYFTTENGRANPPRKGKVYFLTRKEKRPMKQYRVDWQKLLLEQTVVHTTSTSKGTVKLQDKKIVGLEMTEEEHISMFQKKALTETASVKENNPLTVAPISKIVVDDTMIPQEEPEKIEDSPDDKNYVQDSESRLNLNKDLDQDNNDEILFIEPHDI